MSELKEKWEKTGLMAGINENKLEEAALMLEAQYLQGQTIDSAQFKRIGIPLMRRVIGESATFSRNIFKNLSEAYSEPTRHMFNVKYPFTTQYDGHGGELSLDYEAGNVAKTAAVLAKEIDEIFKDQINKQIFIEGFRADEKTGCIFVRYALT